MNIKCLTVFLTISLQFVTSALAGEMSFPSAGFTPYGAKMEANGDGSIPPWQGGGGKQHDFEEKMLDDKPLYEINASNVKQYEDQLPSGLRALIDRYPETMRIPVYTSYRPAYFPAWVYQGIEKNHTSALLADNGDSVTNTFPGIPFPVPKTGYEVLWNHLLAYKGVFVDVSTWDTVVLKGRKSSIIKSRVKFGMEYYRKDRGISGLDQMYAYYLSSVTSPPKLAGGGLLVHERVNASRIPRQGWGYMAGQRRVIRIPSIDYDAPMPRSDGIRFADEVDIYNGSVDRYQWRLIGKKELIIPYNNDLLYSRMKAVDGVESGLLTPFHMNPDFLRYEKHRVWVIEGVLKQDNLHPYKKRVLYLDEDSWLTVVAENYAKGNQLWRVSASYVRQYHTLPAIFKVIDSFHDLREKSYYVQGALDDGTSIAKQEMPPKIMFKPIALRRLGKR